MTVTNIEADCCSFSLGLKSVKKIGRAQLGRKGNEQTKYNINRFNDDVYNTNPQPLIILKYDQTKRLTPLPWVDCKVFLTYKASPNP